MARPASPSTCACGAGRAAPSRVRAGAHSPVGSQLPRLPDRHLSSELRPLVPSRQPFPPAAHSDSPRRRPHLVPPLTRVPSHTWNSVSVHLLLRHLFSVFISLKEAHRRPFHKLSSPNRAPACSPLLSPTVALARLQLRTCLCPRPRKASSPIFHHFHLSFINSLKASAYLHLSQRHISILPKGHLTYLPHLQSCRPDGEPEVLKLFKLSFLGPA